MWLSDNIRYGKELGYVMLQLPPAKLPIFTLDEVTYDPKEELHCSLLCTKRLAEAFPRSEEAEASIFEFIKQYCRQHTFIFSGFTDKVYVCTEGDVKSVVIGAIVEGVDELFAALRVKYLELVALPAPALHVTLYKFNHQFGIGIQNEKQLQELCRPIPLDILPKEVRSMV